MELCRCACYFYLPGGSLSVKGLAVEFIKCMIAAPARCWLDIKMDGSLQQVADMQQEFLQKADAANRKLEILIGIPDDDVKNNFLKLNNYQAVPSLCESFSDVPDVNALVWGARWTDGTQDDDVAQLHASGKKAIVWTLDIPEFIKPFINDGHFDGVLSNYPSVNAYYYYAKP